MSYSSGHDMQRKCRIQFKQILQSQLNDTCDTCYHERKQGDEQNLQDFIYKTTIIAIQISKCRMFYTMYFHVITSKLHQQYPIFG